MHLHLVSTQAKAQTAVSSSCEEYEARQGQREHPATPCTEHREAERAARVEALRRLVHAGTYQIDSLAIAETLLKKQVNFI